MDRLAVGPVPATVFDGSVVLGEPPNASQKQRNGVGRDLLGTVVGDVDDCYVVFDRGLEVDLVDTDAGAGDDLQLLAVLEHLGWNGGVDIDDKADCIGGGVDDIGSRLERNRVDCRLLAQDCLERLGANHCVFVCDDCWHVRVASCSTLLNDRSIPRY